MGEPATSVSRHPLDTIAHQDSPPGTAAVAPGCGGRSTRRPARGVPLSVLIATRSIRARIFLAGLLILRNVFIIPQRLARYCPV